MGRFWDSATDQAGREFGARHYRWFAGARVARRMAPPLFVLTALVAVVVGVAWLYRWADPNWSAIGDRVTGWAGAVPAVLLGVAGAAAALLILTMLVRTVRRNWWSWWHLSRPMWLRRY